MGENQHGLSAFALYMPTIIHLCACACRRSAGRVFVWVCACVCLCVLACAYVWEGGLDLGA